MAPQRQIVRARHGSCRRRPLPRARFPRAGRPRRTNRQAPRLTGRESERHGVAGRQRRGLRGRAINRKQFGAQHFDGNPQRAHVREAVNRGQPGHAVPLPARRLELEQGNAIAHRGGARLVIGSLGWGRRRRRRRHDGRAFQPRPEVRQHGQHPLGGTVDVNRFRHRPGADRFHGHRGYALDATGQDGRRRGRRHYVPQLFIVRPLGWRGWPTASGPVTNSPSHARSTIRRPWSKK
jgi:hypothetical protein